MNEVFGEEYGAARRVLYRYWMHRCDEDALSELIKTLRGEMMANIRFDILRRVLIQVTISGAVHRANRMVEWWWEE